MIDILNHNRESIIKQHYHITNCYLLVVKVVAEDIPDSLFLHKLLL